MTATMSAGAFKRFMVAAAVVVMALTLLPSPAHAQYAGCWSGQVGLYTQFNGGGHCYGFAGSNNSFAQWGINDRIRSGKNIGTSGLRARIHRNTNYTGGVGFCLAMGAQGNNPSSPQGESNNWASHCL